jgi:hypothetical protein
VRDALREGPEAGREVFADSLDKRAEQEAEWGPAAATLLRMPEEEAHAHSMTYFATRLEQEWQLAQKRIRGERRHELQALEVLCVLFQDASGRKAALSKSKVDGGWQGGWFAFAIRAAVLAWPGRKRDPSDLIVLAARNVRAKELEREKELKPLWKELKRRRKKRRDAYDPPDSGPS